MLEAALNVNENIDDAVKKVDERVRAHYIDQAGELDLFDSAYYKAKDAVDKMSTYVHKKKEKIKQNPIGGFFNYNYIGPGTKFNAQTPINKLDQIGRLHDMDYRFAHKEPNKEKRNKNLIQADRNMIRRMEQIPINEQDNFYHFVKHAMKMKILATEAGILPADLFVNKGPKSPANKTNIISRFVNNKLSQRRTLEADEEKRNFVYETPQKQKNVNDDDDEKFETPLTSKPNFANFVVNKTSDETSELLDKHYNNLSSHKKNVDSAISSNNNANILVELGSPEHYPLLLQNAAQQKNIEGVLGLAQHYSNNLQEAIGQLEHTMSSSGIQALSNTEMNEIRPSSSYLQKNFVEIPSTADKKIPSIFSPRKTRVSKNNTNYNPSPQYYRPTDHNELRIR
jgi:hypothetical protein